MNRLLLINPVDEIVGVGSPAAMISERKILNALRGFIEGGPGAPDGENDNTPVEGYITVPTSHRHLYNGKRGELEE